MTAVQAKLQSGVTRPSLRVIRWGGFSVRVDTRVLALAALSLAALAALMIWSMTLGDYPLAPAEVIRAARGIGEPEAVLIVRDVRLPRVCAAALVGAALAISGALFQGVARNPLVSPDVVGISQGAGLLAVFWIVVGRAPSLLPLAAFAGALGSALVVYLLAWQRGVSPGRLILVGIGVGAALHSLTTYLTVKFPIEQARPALVWLLGSLYGADWVDVRVLAIGLILGLPIALVLVWPLSTMQLGDETARTLGLSVEHPRFLALFVGSALAASAVAVAGPVAFVALMVPHIARMTAGPLSAGSLVYTGGLGACLVVLSDMAGQHALPLTLPVGIITGLVGAPYFLYLLTRHGARM